MLNSESELEIGRSALSVGRFLMRSAIALPFTILSILFAPPASAAETKTILVLGDSLSQGWTRAKRSLPDPACKEIARNRPEFSGNQCQRRRRHHGRRLGAASGSSET